VKIALHMIGNQAMKKVGCLNCEEITLLQLCDLNHVWVCIWVLRGMQGGIDHPEFHSNSLTIYMWQINIPLAVKPIARFRYSASGSLHPT
jgi:hypothetical protein